MTKIIKVTKVDGSIQKGVVCYLNTDHIIFCEDQFSSYGERTKITLTNEKISPISVEESKEEILALIHANNIE